MATTATPPTKPAKPAKTPPVGAARPIRKLVPNAPPVVRFYRSAVGKKWVMAVTGVILMGFVVDPPARQPEALPVEGGDQPLRRGVAQHAGSPAAAHILAVDDPHGPHPRVRAPHPLRVQPHSHQRRRRARRDTSRKRDYVAADFASRTMRWTGIIMLLYLVFHLMDLTWGNANAQFVRGDPYNNLVYSLQRPVGRGRLRRREHRARVPPVPRHLVDVPEHGHQQPTHQQAADGRSRPGFAVLILIGNVSFPISSRPTSIEAASVRYAEPTTRPCKA